MPPALPAHACHGCGRHAVGRTRPQQQPWRQQPRYIGSHPPPGRARPRGLLRAGKPTSQPPDAQRLTAAEAVSGRHLCLQQMRRGAWPAAIRPVLACDTARIARPDGPFGKPIRQVLENAGGHPRATPASHGHAYRHGRAAEGAAGGAEATVTGCHNHRPRRAATPPRARPERGPAAINAAARQPKTLHRRFANRGAGSWL